MNNKAGLFKSLISLIIVFGLLMPIFISSCGDNDQKTIDIDRNDSIPAAYGEGKMLFMKNCASCHSIFKNLTGPALSEIVEIRDSTWIFKFLTNRKLIREDSISQSFKKEFTGVYCQSFPDLSRENVNGIVSYIRFSLQRGY